MRGRVRVSIARLMSLILVMGLFFAIVKSLHGIQRLMLLFEVVITLFCLFLLCLSGLMIRWIVGKHP